MKARRKLIGLSAVVLLAGRVLGQISDMTPPKLVEFEISPSIVDISTNDQTVTLTARITDDLGGFGNPDIFGFSIGAVTFRPMVTDAIPQSASAQFYPDSRVSGDQFDGLYRTEMIIPTHSRTGIWSIVSFTLRDEVGNTAALTPSDVRGLGLPITFTVIGGIEDRVPPEILSLSLDPMTVDTSTTNQAITVITHIHEDVSWAGGIDPVSGLALPGSGFLQFRSPSKRQTVVAGLFNEEISGDDHDGMFRTTINVPQFSEPGVWRLSTLRLNDRVGNVLLLDIGAALARGLPTEFTVTGVGDPSPPTLRAFDIYPRRVGLPTTNQSMTISARYDDDLSGFFTFDTFGNPVPNFTIINFRSPSKQQIATARLLAISEPDQSLRVSATNTLEFPRFCETGVWTLAEFILRDAVGNATNLDLTTIRRLGFPTEVAVGITPQLRIDLQDDSILVSWPAWGSSFRLESREIAGTDWSVDGNPSAIGDQLVTALPRPTESKLFRLRE